MENKERGVIEEEKRAIDSQIADIDEQLEQLSRRENWNSRPPEHGKTVALVNGFEAFEAFVLIVLNAFSICFERIFFLNFFCTSE